ncbi:hypothetical protein EYF80_055663 [Liparis tanakae]|uniref:Uncharacterized protein n=1 Tax=Liparis tanakae TaxID=230148 RepID=A0A4Z2EZQ0_9TELE|nr:hypothetical protein EYF80_055663 [Liparis tanakae]
MCESFDMFKSKLMGGNGFPSYSALTQVSCFNRHFDCKGSYSWSMAQVTILRMRCTALPFSRTSRGPTASLLMDVSWTAAGTASSALGAEKS